MKGITKKNLPYVLLAVLLVMAIFFLLDYIAHSLSAEYSVPGYYFRNKVIFGLPLILASYWIFAKQKLWIRALAVSGITSILLQIRYFIEGYPLDFVILFLFLHFAMLFAGSMLVFYLLRKKLE